MNTYRNDPDGELNQRATRDNERYVGALNLQHQHHKTMNVNDIKAELEKLLPEKEAAWDAYKDAEATIKHKHDDWYNKQIRCNQLEAAIAVLEPKGEPEP